MRTDPPRSGPEATAVQIGGDRCDLRWILMHMIERTARHADHADLLREAVEGEVGE